VQRWDLRTFQREKTVPVPDGMTVAQVKMGYNSQGPLALWGGGKATLMDVDRMEPMEIEGGAVGGGVQWHFHLRVSPNGQVFVCWHNDIGPSDFTVMRLNGRKATMQVLGGGNMNERWVMPNADGSYMFGASFTHLMNADLKAPSADWLTDWQLSATADPRYFLAASGLQFSVCTSSDRRPVVTVTDKALQRMNSSSMPSRWFYFDREEPRIRYLPEANVVAILPMDDKQVVVRPLNLIEELGKDGKEYLFVLSQPKTIAQVGSLYTYQMEVKSKSAGVAYKLEKGPEGMTVSGAGEVRWNVPPAQEGKSTPVIVSVKNTGGKELFHTFDLAAVNGTTDSTPTTPPPASVPPPVTSSPAVPLTMAPPNTPPSPVQPLPEEKPAGPSPKKSDATPAATPVAGGASGSAYFPLQLPGGFVMTPDNVTLIVSQPKAAKLIYFDTVADKERKQVQLDFKPAALALQGATLFAAGEGSSQVYALDVATGKVKKKFDLGGDAVAQLVCLLH
jgi:PQQ enzyme repeat